MAHDNQHKDSPEGVRINRFDYPKRGELYWNRDAHRVEEADEDLQEKFLVVERGD